MHGGARTLGIDVGGSTIKAALVDTARGRLASERWVVETPRAFALADLVERIHEIVEAHPQGEAVGIGFPAAVRNGVVESPPTAYEFEDWVGVDLRATLSAQLDRPVAVANDADCAGLAEMAQLDPEDRLGVVLFFTLGTGVGSALFIDGRLVPNTELGKLYLPGRSETAEQSVASRIRSESQLSWEEWSDRLAEYLVHIDRLFSPSRIVLGGGIIADADRFLARLKIGCPVTAACAGNDAGIIGAAMAFGL